MARKEQKRMYKGESGYTSNADDIIRKFGMAIPFVIIAYGLLAQFGYIESNNYRGPLTLGLIMVGWIILGIAQFTTPSKTALTSIIRLGADHILAALSFLLIAEAAIVLWPIATMAAYIYFGKVGIKYNILCYMGITLIDIIIHWDSWSYIITSLVTALTIVITSVAIIVVSRSHEIKQEKIYKSKVKESLQRDRAAAIVNNLTDAIISTDSNGIIRVYNAASLSLLDTNVSLNGHNINKALRLFDNNGDSIDIISIAKMSNIVEQRDDLYLITKDGDKTRLSVTYTPIRRGYSNTKKSELHDGFIIILRDITKEKELEEERDEFISVASHELRTPITIAEGIISNVLIMIKRPDTTTDMLKSSIQVAHDQVVFLSNMINDLGTLSRAEHGSADEAVEINVQDLANELMNKYLSEANNKKLTLDLDISPKIDKIYASRLYVEELLQNFMTNAIKYTSTGGVSIIIKQNNKKITFAIKDTGIGISKADQKKIFSKFFRSDDSRIKELNGTGLGLYVGSKLAQKLHTKIELVSRINFGSTFSFSLPTSKPASKNEFTDPSTK